MVRCALTDTLLDSVVVFVLQVVNDQKAGGIVDLQGRRVTLRSNKQAFSKLKVHRSVGYLEPAHYSYELLADGVL